MDSRKDRANRASRLVEMENVIEKNVSMLRHLKRAGGKLDITDEDGRHALNLIVNGCVVYHRTFDEREVLVNMGRPRGTELERNLNMVLSAVVNTVESFKG